MSKNENLPQITTTIPIAKLIDAMKKTRDAEIKEATVRHAEFSKQRAAWLQEYRTALRKKLSQLKPGFVMPKRTSSGRRISEIDEWLVADLPEEPSDPGQDPKCIRDKWNGLIAQLSMSKENDIRVTPEAFAKFMAGNPAACRC